MSEINPFLTLKFKLMKIKLLLLAAIGCFSVANAQFTVADRAGNVLNDGDVIEFGSTDYSDSEYEFYVTNDNPNNEIYTRIEVLSMENSTTGSFEQLCYGLCYNDLVTGETVPPASDPALDIAVGETTGLGNHFWNNDPGNGADNVDFQFAFRQYEDPAGTIEIGTPLIFTYRYNPTLSVAENNIVNLTLESTVVSNQLVFNTNEAVNMMVYNVQGAVVKQGNFDAGRQIVNVSNLSPQAYIVQFKNNKGGVKTTKFIVQ